jgi:hypothetical protein
MPDPVRVPVQSPTGQIGSVDEADVPNLPIGARVLTPEQVALYQPQPAPYEGFGHGLAAGIHEAGRMIMPFGLHEAVGKGLENLIHGEGAGEKWAEKVRGEDEAHPLARLAGGAVGLAAGSGMGLGALGEGAASVAGRALPEASTALGGLARGAGVGIARGAAEGAALGASQGTADWVLSPEGDHKTAAEYILAGTEGGAVTGGILGGTLGAAGKLVGNLLPKWGEAARAADDAAAKAGMTSGELDRTVTDSMAGRAMRKDAEENLANKLGRDTPEFKAAKADLDARGRLQEQTNQHFDKLSKETTDVIDKIMEDHSEVSRELFGGAKDNQMQRLVPEENGQAARDAGLGLAREIKSAVVDTLEALPSQGDASLKVKDLRKYLDEYMSSIRETKAGSNLGADVMNAADKLKQKIQRLAAFDAKDVHDLPEGVVHDTYGMRGAYRLIRQFLENEEVFGPAATAQREINAAVSKSLDEEGVMLSEFTRGVSKSGKRVADRGKIFSALRNIDSPTKDIALEYLDRYVSNEKALLDVAEKHYELSSSAKAKAEDIRSSIKRLGEILSEAEKKGQELSLAKMLRAREGTNQVMSTLAGAAGGVAGGLPGGAIGGWMGGTAGGLGGRAVGKLMAERAVRPIHYAEQMAEAAEAADRFSKAVHDRVGNVFSRAKAKAIGVPTKNRSEKFNELATKIRTVAAGTVSIGQHIADKAPQTAAALDDHAKLVVTNLAKNLPERTNKPALVPSQDTPRYEDKSVYNYMQYFKVANEPLTAVDDLKAGRLTHIQVSALKDNWPGILTKIRAQVTAELAKQKKEPSPQLKDQLDILFDRTNNDDELVQALQKTYTDMAQKPRPHAGGKMPDFITSQASNTDRLEKR